MTDKEDSDVRVKEPGHDIKIPDKAARAVKSAEQVYIRVREQAEIPESDEDITPEEYAGDRVRGSVEDAASKAKRRIKRSSGKRGKTGKKRASRTETGEETTSDDDVPSGEVQDSAEAEKPDPDDRNKKHNNDNKELCKVKAPEEARTETVGGDAAERYGVRTHEARYRRTRGDGRVSDSPGRSAVKTRETLRRGDIRERTVGAFPAVRRDIRTGREPGTVSSGGADPARAVREGRILASNRERTRAESMAYKAAETARKTAENIERAVSRSVKRLMESSGKLAGAMAAGLGVSAVAVVLICLIGMLTGSAYGIFFSGEDTGGGYTMRDAVKTIEDDYRRRLDMIRSSFLYDEVEMSGSTAVWSEVLALYTVRIVNDPTDQKEAATVDDEKIGILMEIFWDMNEIGIRTRTRTVTVIRETDDGAGNIVEEETEESRVTLYITVSHRTPSEMADIYGFTDYEKEQLEDLLDKDKEYMWSAVLYGIGAGDTDIVSVALSQVGNVGGSPYWTWYGFSSRVEWCACFVSWCANECGYIESGIIPKFASCANGVRWFRERDRWLVGGEEPLPGMIIFFDWDRDGRPDHTGIVERVENGTVYTVEGNSGNRCRERQYSVSYTGIYGYGAPVY